VKITLELLKDWNACERALKWFEKDYPDGVDDTIEGLVKRIPADWEYDALWLLHEVAARVAGVEGDEALALLVERADPSRLAKAVLEIARRDTSAAMERLLQVGDAPSLVRVIERGTDTQAVQAIDALRAADPAVQEVVRGV